MATGDNITVSKAELQQMLREAVQCTPRGTHSLSESDIHTLIGGGVKQAFTEIGIDCKNPLEMQKDFAFIRNTRKALATTMSTARATAVGLVVTGILTVILLGLKAMFGKPTP